MLCSAVSNTYVGPEDYRVRHLPAVRPMSIEEAKLFRGPGAPVTGHQAYCLDCDASRPFHSYTEAVDWGERHIASHNPGLQRPAEKIAA